MDDQHVTKVDALIRMSSLQNYEIAQALDFIILKISFVPIVFPPTYTQKALQAQWQNILLDIHTKSMCPNPHIIFPQFSFWSSCTIHIVAPYQNFWFSYVFFLPTTTTLVQDFLVPYPDKCADSSTALLPTMSFPSQSFC